VRCAAPQTPTPRPSPGRPRRAGPAAPDPELQRLCAGAAAAKRLAAALPPSAGSGGGAADARAAVDAGLAALGAALAAARGAAAPRARGHGSGGARRAVVCQLVGLAAEGPAGGSGGSGGADGCQHAAAAAAAAALEVLPLEDLGASRAERLGRCRQGRPRRVRWGPDQDMTAAPCIPTHAEALPTCALADALLLAPGLLDGLLGAAARDACEPAPSQCTSGRAVPLSAALGAHPTWRCLPGILAAQPALYHRVSWGVGEPLVGAWPGACRAAGTWTAAAAAARLAWQRSDGARSPFPSTCPGAALPDRLVAAEQPPAAVAAAQRHVPTNVAAAAGGRRPGDGRGRDPAAAAAAAAAAAVAAARR
jgi:hypothetical protein